MKANWVPAARTEAQSTLPCHFEMSMPWIGCCLALRHARMGLGVALGRVEVVVRRRRRRASPAAAAATRALARACATGRPPGSRAEIREARSSSATSMPSPPSEEAPQQSVFDGPGAVNGLLPSLRRNSENACRAETYDRDPRLRSQAPVPAKSGAASRLRSRLGLGKDLFTIGYEGLDPERLTGALRDSRVWPAGRRAGGGQLAQARLLEGRAQAGARGGGPRATRICAASARRRPAARPPGPTTRR